MGVSDDVDDCGEKVDVTIVAVNQLRGRTTPPTCWWFGSFKVGMAVDDVIQVTMMMIRRRREEKTSLMMVTQSGSQKVPTI